ncbi:hypothetical protein ACOSP7_000822 [Xanthoceras sorbifolium]
MPGLSLSAPHEIYPTFAPCANQLLDSKVWYKNTSIRSVPWIFHTSTNGDSSSIFTPQTNIIVAPEPNTQPVLSLFFPVVTRIALYINDCTIIKVETEKHDGKNKIIRHTFHLWLISS